MRRNQKGLENVTQKQGETAENSDLSTVEVLDDGEMQVLLPLPLALHRVTQKLPQGSLGPFQQLVVQQKCIRGLCTHTHVMKIHTITVASNYFWFMSCSSTCVILRFQMQVIQLVNVADVHFLFIQLSFVEVLKKRDKEWM